MSNLFSVLWQILGVVALGLFCLLLLYIVVVLAIVAYKQIREMLDE